MKAVQTIFNVFFVVLALDFASGVLHWLEDSYGNPDWPILGPWIIEPNILPHRCPTEFTKKNWVQSSGPLLALGGVTIVIASLFDVLTWQLLLFAAIGVNVNQIHKWNHLPTSKRNSMALLLQKMSLVQTPAHHARHHTGLKNTNYCVVTNLVNPILEALHFWRALEWTIERLLGVSKRRDPTVIGQASRESAARGERLSTGARKASSPGDLPDDWGSF